MLTFNLVNNGKTIKTFAKERDDLSCFIERLIWVHTVNGLGTGTLVTQWWGKKGHKLDDNENKEEMDTWEIWPLPECGEQGRERSPRWLPNENHGNLEKKR